MPSAHCPNVEWAGSRSLDLSKSLVARLPLTRHSVESIITLDTALAPQLDRALVVIVARTWMMT